MMNSINSMNGAGGMVNNSCSGNTMMMMNRGMVNMNNMNGCTMNMNNMNGGMMIMNNMNGGMMTMNNMNADMMNHSGSNMMMMNSNNNGISNFTPSSSSLQQQQNPPQPLQLAMNVNVMQPMNNTISNNFGVGFGAAPSSANLSSPGRQAGGGSNALNNKKPDPFAGLGF